MGAKGYIPQIPSNSHIFPCENQCHYWHVFSPPGVSKVSRHTHMEDHLNLWFLIRSILGAHFYHFYHFYPRKCLEALPIPGSLSTDCIRLPQEAHRWIRPSFWRRGGALQREHGRRLADVGWRLGEDAEDGHQWDIMWVKHGKTMPFFTYFYHLWLGMVTISPTYGDDWGMVYYCFTNNIIYTYIYKYNLDITRI